MRACGAELNESCAAATELLQGVARRVAGLQVGEWMLVPAGFWRSAESRLSAMLLMVEREVRPSHQTTYAHWDQSLRLRFAVFCASLPRGHGRNVGIRMRATVGERIVPGPRV